MSTETEPSRILRWVASEYLDDGRWGVLTECNEIVVGIAWGLSRERCEYLAEAHNDTACARPIHEAHTREK